ncbi:hypothetical protein [Roseibium sediminicola]|uniref:Uncharacterized protein n=1 Tax=Roseibium sediminicola TaxID=2933272 RepID=A0ABT0H343_9HYPH|nr:hypothetical protein [Roseibium sp. CAU 1639]MCK7616104.1 hypothetical protein [Roseibium sp. CAU 1639]
MSQEPNQPEFPALSDDEIHKSLDDIATLLAGQSNRMDEQTKVLNRLREVATEARQAAFAARDQTDPEQYADFAVTLLEDRTGKIIDRMNDVASGLIRASNHTATVLKEAEQDRSAAQRQLWDREQKLDRFKRRLPLMGLGALVLALAMTVTMPRFLASYEFTCELMVGFAWTTTSTDTNVCVRYVE